MFDNDNNDENYHKSPKVPGPGKVPISPHLMIFDPKSRNPKWIQNITKSTGSHVLLCFHCQVLCPFERLREAEVRVKREDDNEKKVQKKVKGRNLFLFIFKIIGFSQALEKDLGFLPLKLNSISLHNSWPDLTRWRLFPDRWPIITDLLSLCMWQRCKIKTFPEAQQTQAMSIKFEFFLQLKLIQIQCDWKDK